MRTMAYGTGVHPNTKCFKCRITAAKSSKLPAVATGINHPEYAYTLSFYRYGEHKHACPRCHRELQLESTMQAMDNYEKRHGKQALKLVLTQGRLTEVVNGGIR